MMSCYQYNYITMYHYAGIMINHVLWVTVRSKEKLRTIQFEIKWISFRWLCITLKYNESFSQLDEGSEKRNSNGQRVKKSSCVLFGQHEKDVDQIRNVRLLFQHHGEDVCHALAHGPSNTKKGLSDTFPMSLWLTHTLERIKKEWAENSLLFRATLVFRAGCWIDHNRASWLRAKIELKRQRNRSTCHLRGRSLRRFQLKGEDCKNPELTIPTLSEGCQQARKDRIYNHKIGP